MAIDINNIPRGQIPPEIARAFSDFLKVEGRVKFPLKPTTPSAFSSTAEEPDIQDADKEVDDLISHVADMENTVEQLEDMLDQLTKDMNIPVDPSNKPLARAVKRLGGDDAITQEVFNTALAIIDHAPLITLRQDPVIAALTGDGHLDGPWLDCSQVTAQAADFFNLRTESPLNPEDPVVPRNDDILNDFEGNLLETILHLVLMLWWNMIWPKFLVDLVIIDPLRMMIADPFDKIAGFFKKEKRFRRKSKAWVRSKGKVNKALNKFRKFLLCKVPYKLWSTADKDYDPIVQITCPEDEIYTCPEDGTNYDSTGSASSTDFNPDGDASEMGVMMDEVDGDGEDDSGICGAPEEYGQNAPDDEPTGLGMSPECLKAASRVVSAVEDTVFTSRSPSSSTPTLQTDLSDATMDSYGA